MILIECPETSERALVESAEGYEGWRVVAEDAPLPPPGEGWRWIEHDRRWRMDPALRLKAENLAGMRDHEVLLAIIEDLIARSEDLAARLEALEATNRSKGATR